MAKKKIPTEKKKKSFSELNDFLNTIAPDGEMIEDNPIAKIDEWIPTGWYILNAALSGSLFGGLPNRRSLVLAGEEGTGKTFIALSIVRNAEKRDYHTIYFDSEGAIDLEFVTRLGVDTSKIRLQPVNTIEEFTHIGSQLISQFEKAKAAKEDPPKVMVVLDSLGNLTSIKESEDATEGSNKRDMTKQQSIRKLFRVIGLKFAKHGIPFIINNHVYDSMSMFSPKEISGGGGLKYNASIILVLGKGKLDDPDAEKKAKKKNVEAAKVGITIFVNPFKQRFARPIKVQIHIPFYKKPNPFVGLEKFVSWESVGIVRGRCITEKEYDKLSDSDKKKCFEFTKSDGEKVYANPNPKAQFLVCRHLEGETPIANLFTDLVFTKDVLEELDEKVIKPTFQLPSIESLEDLAEIAEELDPLGSEDDDENTDE
jgi:RecA/RadA recombinase